MLDSKVNKTTHIYIYKTKHTINKMVLQNFILPLLIGIVATYLLMSMLYNNSPKLRQCFSDLGAFIQLQASRPAYYLDFVPENQNVYNEVIKSGFTKADTINPDYYGYQANPYMLYAPPQLGQQIVMHPNNSEYYGYQLNPYVSNMGYAPVNIMTYQ